MLQTVVKRSAARAKRPLRPTAPRIARPKVPALKRGLAVVRFLNGSLRLSAGVTEVSHSLGLTKSVAFNILKTLQEEGWVEFDIERRKYVLSPNSLSDFSNLLMRSTRSTAIHEELVKLSLKIRVPCVLSRIEPDGTFVTIDKAEEASELLVSVPIGHRFPDDAPAQMRARLAWSNIRTRREALKRWKPVKHTPTTIVDRRALEKELEATLARGYSISRAEFTPGVVSLAAPICSKAGRPLLVLQCPGVEPDISAREKDIAAELLATVRAVAAILAAP